MNKVACFCIKCGFVVKAAAVDQQFDCIGTAVDTETNACGVELVMIEHNTQAKRVEPTGMYHVLSVNLITKSF